MKIVLCADHAGFELKQQIKEYLSQNYQLEDVGAHQIDNEDSYVLYAQKASKKVLENAENKGIFVCGSGVGMNIVANKQKGVRAVLAFQKDLAVKSREHNNANVLCLGGRFINFDDAKEIIDAFLQTEFLGGKYQKRVEDIE